jgi:uncharacterized protein
MVGMSESPSVFRPGGVSYLRIPAEDPQRVAAFYVAVFGWSLRDESDEPAFSDRTGHVIGHFVSDGRVAGSTGIRPYIYTDDLDAALERVRAEGGEVTTPPYSEGDLRVATFRDPAGNVAGVWQHVG